ncbi:hypothetical protein llap_6570 [Limosa lapponica baueri]|uniref:Uncharacterized protein n=1 Tax=Limosa lapponica baueri TaxID=1758121 RepID=A0A2I0UAP9_LIMLA|nr:hypothetical protein llap_6570 [Limosa lapponica baueri]
MEEAILRSWSAGTFSVIDTKDKAEKRAMARNQKEIFGNNVGKRFERGQLGSEQIDGERLLDQQCTERKLARQSNPGYTDKVLVAEKSARLVQSSSQEKMCKMVLTKDKQSLR